MESNKTDKKMNAVIAGLLIIIAILIYQNAKFKKEMEYLQSRIVNIESSINSGISNLYYTIPERIESFFKEQQSIVTDFSYNYYGADMQNGTLKTIISFSLKQVDKDSKIYINVMSQDNTNGENYECESENGLDYTCKADLSVNYDYVLNVYQKTGEGNYLKLNTDAYYLNAKSDFANKLSISESGTATDKEKTDFSFSLQNKTFGEKGLKIKSIIVKCFYDGREVFAQDVTDKNIVNSEARDRINVMIAAGELNPESVPAIEYGTVSEDENGNEYGSFIVSVPHSETGAPVENNKFPEYNFKVIITFNNGEVLEY